MKRLTRPKPKRYGGGGTPKIGSKYIPRHEIRLLQMKIIHTINEIGPSTATEIQTKSNLSRHAVQKHLKLLREDLKIEFTNTGKKYTYYPIEE